MLAQLHNELVFAIQTLAGCTIQEMSLVSFQSFIFIQWSIWHITSEIDRQNPMQVVYISSLFTSWTCSVSHKAVGNNDWNISCWVGFYITRFMNYKLITFASWRHRPWHMDMLYAMGNFIRSSHWSNTYRDKRPVVICMTCSATWPIGWLMWRWVVASVPLRLDKVNLNMYG